VAALKLPKDKSTSLLAKERGRYRPII